MEEPLPVYEGRRSPKFDRLALLLDELANVRHLHEEIERLIPIDPPIDAVHTRASHAAAQQPHHEIRDPF